MLTSKRIQILISSISACLVVLLSVCVQVGNAKINEWNRNIFLLQNNVLNKSTLIIRDLTKYNVFSIQEILVTLFPGLELGYKNIDCTNVAEEIKGACKNMQENKMTEKDFLVTLKSIHGKEGAALEDDYSKLAQEINDRIDSPPMLFFIKWSTIINICLGVQCLLGAILLLLTIVCKREDR